jgi:hypothetical protein
MSRSLRANLLVNTSSEEENEEQQTPAPKAVGGEQHSNKERGIPILEQKKFFERIESLGGFEVLIHKSKLLQKICDEKQQAFGSPSNCKTPRRQRRKVSNFVDKLKQLDPQKRAERRAKIFKQGELIELSPPPTARATTTTTTTSLTTLFLTGADIPGQHYDFTYNDDIYGDLVVTEFIDEEVDKKYVNGFAILLPSQDICDVYQLKACIVGEDNNQVEVVHGTNCHCFLNNSSDWICKLEGKKRSCML